MPKVKPTQADLVTMLRRQLRYLAASSTAFDEGDEDEAARIAVVLRVLFHDTTRSVSLLQQLGIKHKIQYLDTGHFYSVSIIYETVDGDTEEVGPYGLAQWDLGASPPTWYAPLEACAQDAPTRDFRSWWKSPVVRGGDYAPDEGISRWDLVDWMAHQDGGAHVDPRGLDERYVKYLLEGDGSQWGIGSPDDQHLANLQFIAGNGAACAMRQIAYEVTESLAASDDVAALLRD